jgi:hypothetical protein
VNAFLKNIIERGIPRKAAEPVAFSNAQFTLINVKML